MSTLPQRPAQRARLGLPPFPLLLAYRSLIQEAFARAVVDLTAEQDLHTDAAAYRLAQAAQTADALMSMGVAFSDAHSRLPFKNGSTSAAK